MAQALGRISHDPTSPRDRRDTIIEDEPQIMDGAAAAVWAAIRTTTITTDDTFFSEDQTTPRANAHTASSNGASNQMTQTSQRGLPGFVVRYRPHGLTLSPLDQRLPPIPSPKITPRQPAFSRKNSRGQVYDDLYDSDSGSEDVPLVASRSVKAFHHPARMSTGSASSSSTSASRGPARNYPPLAIPSPSMWPTIEKLRSATSPLPKSRVVPPSPSHILTPTARALNMIAAKNAQVPNGSAAPSLDGSMTSEELSSISCPSTPDVGNDPDTDDGEWAGTVQLEPEAMETLQRFRLSSFDEHSEGGGEQVIEIHGEMRETRFANGDMSTSFSLVMTPVDRNPPEFFPTLSNPGSDLDPLSALSVPSPGGFFGSLNSNARNTWGPASTMPTTSTAISFYGVPWKRSRDNSPERIVERMVEVDELSDSDTAGPPTARRVPGTDSSNTPSRDVNETSRTQPSAVVPSTSTSSFAPSNNARVREFLSNLEGGSPISEPREGESPRLRSGTPELRLVTDFSGGFDYNPKYAAEQREVNSSHLDRTGLWLASQHHYLAGLRGDLTGMTNGDDSPIVGRIASGGTEPRRSISDGPSTALSPSKSVRFADDPEIAASIDSALARLNGESPPRARRPILAGKSRTSDVVPQLVRPMPTRSPSTPELNSTPVSSSPASILSPPGSTIVPPPLPPIPETAEPASAAEDKDDVFMEGFKYLHSLQERPSPPTKPTGFVLKSSPAAAFSHRKARNEALRLHRFCLPEKHRDNLSGVFSLEERQHIDPKRPVSAWHGANSGAKSGGAEDDPEDKEAQARKAVARALKERHALDQIKPISWNLEATKMLNGGTLLTSPASREFASLSASLGHGSPASPEVEPKESKKVDLFDQALKDQYARKVLDLGGKATADWAWQMAIEYPRVGVWTACVDECQLNKKVFGPLPPLPGAPTGAKPRTSSAKGKDKKDSAGSNDDPPRNDAALLKSPSNHYEIKVPHLWSLPFPDSSFDVVSARSLYSILKTRIPPSAAHRQDSSSSADSDDSSATITAGNQTRKRARAISPARPLDEYDRTLQEVFRVLKPGGYLEFALLDADIIGGGPITQKLSVEFAFNLRTRGYDPVATQGFLSRVRRSGFHKVRRAWIILPMSGVGAPPCGPWVDRGLAWEQEGRRGLGVETAPRSTAEKLRQLEREREQERTLAGQTATGRGRKHSDATSSVRTVASSWYSYAARSSTLRSSGSSATAVSHPSSNPSARTSATSLTLHSQGPSGAGIGEAKAEGKSEIGTTADASYITGVVGAWAWERWMLKLHTEMGREGDQLLEGVAAALEEGARMGGSWRYLSGWARKDLK